MAAVVEISLSYRPGVANGSVEAMSSLRSLSDIVNILTCLVVRYLSDGETVLSRRGMNLSTAYERGKVGLLRHRRDDFSTGVGVV